MTKRTPGKAVPRGTRNIYAKFNIGLAEFERQEILLNFLRISYVPELNEFLDDGGDSTMFFRSPLRARAFKAKLLDRLHELPADIRACAPDDETCVKYLWEILIEHRNFKENAVWLNHATINPDGSYVTFSRARPAGPAAPLPAVVPGPPIVPVGPVVPGGPGSGFIPAFAPPPPPPIPAPAVGPTSPEVVDFEGVSERAPSPDLGTEFLSTDVRPELPGLPAISDLSPGSRHTDLPVRPELPGLPAISDLSPGSRHTDLPVRPELPGLPAISDLSPGSRHTDLPVRPELPGLPAISDLSPGSRHTNLPIREKNPDSPASLDLEDPILGTASPTLEAGDLFDQFINYDADTDSQSSKKRANTTEAEKGGVVPDKKTRKRSRDDEEEELPKPTKRTKRPRQNIKRPRTKNTKKSRTKKV
ncbi:uncharacterized protein N7506_011995 [Penicillium brevicompactum]|uniref:uncharacterized protein n=1 Tax=Penicillium brevicompactum TaxID=5074 RepID=UPI00253F8751|nr:uncharacterized protein N7506_011995 [Penicillium brevicompactum]KAJ5319291.1 hypothetical protein N7506_011995 [Penicillium brevicompactum]